MQQENPDQRRLYATLDFIKGVLDPLTYRSQIAPPSEEPRGQILKNVTIDGMLTVVGDAALINEQISNTTGMVLWLCNRGLFSIYRMNFVPAGTVVGPGIIPVAPGSTSGQSRGLTGPLMDPYPNYGFTAPIPSALSTLTFVQQLALPVQNDITDIVRIQNDLTDQVAYTRMYSGIITMTAGTISLNKSVTLTGSFSASAIEDTRDVCQSVANGAFSVGNITQSADTYKDSVYQVKVDEGVATILASDIPTDFTNPSADGTLHIDGHYQVFRPNLNADGSLPSATINSYSLPTFANPVNILGGAAAFGLLAGGGSVAGSANVVVTGGVVGGTAGVSGFTPGNVTIVTDPGTIANAAIAAFGAYTALTALPFTTLSTGALSVIGYFTPGNYQSNALVISPGTSIILDGQGNPNAQFVFWATGAGPGLTINPQAGSNVHLVNGTQPNGVYWITTGSFEMEAGSFMQGNIIVENAIVLYTTSLVGRALSWNNSVYTLATGSGLGVAVSVPAYIAPPVPPPVANPIGSAYQFAMLANSINAFSPGFYVTGGYVGCFDGGTISWLGSSITPAPYDLEINTALSQQAILDATAGYTYLTGLTFTTLSDHNLAIAGTGAAPNSYYPGNYNAPFFLIPSPITLDGQGDPGAQFVFYADSNEHGNSLIVNNAGNVTCINGANVANVFFVVNGVATLISDAYTPPVPTYYLGTVISTRSIQSNGGNVFGRLIVLGDGGFILGSSLVGTQLTNTPVPNVLPPPITSGPWTSGLDLQFLAYWITPWQITATSSTSFPTTGSTVTTYNTGPIGECSTLRIKVSAPCCVVATGSAPIEPALSIPIGFSARATHIFATCSVNGQINYVSINDIQNFTTTSAGVAYPETLGFTNKDGFLCSAPFSQSAVFNGVAGQQQTNTYGHTVEFRPRMCRTNFTQQGKYLGTYIAFSATPLTDFGTFGTWNTATSNLQIGFGLPTFYVAADDLYDEGQTGPARILRWDKLSTGMQLNVNGQMWAQAIPKSRLSPYLKREMAEQNRWCNSDAIRLLASMVESPKTPIRRVWNYAEYNRYRKEKLAGLSAAALKQFAAEDASIYEALHGSGLWDMVDQVGGGFHQSNGPQQPRIRQREF